MPKHYQQLRSEREWQHYAGEPTAHDALEGAWTRSQLERMDADFAWRLERAFATGQEQRESARAEFRHRRSPQRHNRAYC